MDNLDFRFVQGASLPFSQRKTSHGQLKTSDLGRKVDKAILDPSDEVSRLLGTGAMTHLPIPMMLGSVTNCAYLETSSSW